MISKRSRYVDGVVRSLDTSPPTVMVTRVFSQENVRESFVIWKQGMRLDLLAARLYGNPDEWWRIMDLNPLIQSPTDLVPGMYVRVPGG